MCRLFIISIFLYLAGASNGTMDALQFHEGWRKFDNVEYWNPETSWQNKWAKDEEGKTIVGKEAFWGSSQWFVALTDGWHMVKFLWLTFITLAVVLALSMDSITTAYIEKAGPLEWLLMAGTFALARFIMAIGFHTTYTIIF